MSVFRTQCVLFCFFLHKFSLSYYPLSLLFLLAFVKTGYVNELYLSTGNYSYKSLLNTCSMVTFITYVNVSGLCVSVITFFFLNILRPAFVPFVSLVYVKFSCYVCRYIFHLAQWLTTSQSTFYLHLSVCSLNVKGLGNSLKRRKFSNFLSKKKYSIYLLQEGHCSKKTNPFWSAE